MTSSSIALLGVKGGPAIRPGSSMPTSTLVRMGDRTILVDAGLGAARGVCNQGVGLGEIDTILITHLHADHILELGPLLYTAWTAGLKRKIVIYGPEGLKTYWAGFTASMAYDIDLRVHDEGHRDLAEFVEFRTIGEGVVIEEAGLVVRAMRNLHPPVTDSFSLRFEAGGKSVVLSGDTTFMPEMSAFARGCDVLVHEVYLDSAIDALCARIGNADKDKKKAHFVRSHCRTEDAGRIAREAGVGMLVFNHFVPGDDPTLSDDDWRAGARNEWDGDIRIGRDGMVIEL